MRTVNRTKETKRYFKGVSKAEPSHRAIIVVYDEPQKVGFFDEKAYIAEASFLDCTAITKFTSLKECEEMFYLSKPINNSEYITYKHIQMLIEELYLNQLSGGWPRGKNVANIAGRIPDIAKKTVQDMFADPEPDNDNYEWQSVSKSGKVIRSPFWDWCLMNTIEQNYIEDGCSEQEAEDKFWKDVEDFDKESWNLSLKGRTREEALGDGSLDDVRNEYLYSLDMKAEKVPEKI